VRSKRDSKRMCETDNSSFRCRITFCVWFTHESSRRCNVDNVALHLIGYHVVSLQYNNKEIPIMFSAQYLLHKKVPLRFTAITLSKVCTLIRSESIVNNQKDELPLLIKYVYKL
jgi:hypothetical protein